MDKSGQTLTLTLTQEPLSRKFLIINHWSLGDSNPCYESGFYFYPLSVGGTPCVLYLKKRVAIFVAKGILVDRMTVLH